MRQFHRVFKNDADIHAKVDLLITCGLVNKYLQREYELDLAKRVGGGDGHRQHYYLSITPVQAAVLLGDNDKLKALIKMGADIHQKSLDFSDVRLMQDGPNAIRLAEMIRNNGARAILQEELEYRNTLRGHLHRSYQHDKNYCASNSYLLSAISLPFMVTGQVCKAVVMICKSIIDTITKPFKAKVDAPAAVAIA